MISLKQDYKAVFESALSAWKKREYSRSMELFQEAKLSADLGGDIFYANKALNEIEIRQKKSHIESKVRVIHLTLTDKCNVKCPFCYLERYSAGWDMPAKACEDIITYFPYLQQLTWQGGEAFLHPVFREMIIESSRFRNIQQTLLTNGQFLDKKWLELFFKIHKFHIVISLESAREKIYEELRRGGSFEKLKSNLGLINSLRDKSDNKLHLTLNIIVMKKNYLELEDIVDFAIENGFTHVILTPLYPNGTEFYKKEYLCPADIDIRPYFSEIMPGIYEKAARNNIYLDDRFTGIRNEETVNAEGIDYSEFADVAKCLSPWQQLFIESTGEVKSYCSCQSVIGDLKANPIMEIWNGRMIKELRRSILNYDYRACNPICVEGVLNKSNLKLT